MILPCLSADSQGAILAVYVQPRASRNQIIGLQGHELKVRLTSPPVDGAANKLCCEFLAKLLGLPKTRVRIVAGEKSRHKRLLLLGLDPNEATQTLAGQF